jgi:hypothetical protein
LPVEVAPGEAGRAPPVSNKLRNEKSRTEVRLLAGGRPISVSAGSDNAISANKIR